MDHDQVQREIGQAIRARRTHHNSAVMATGLLEDGSDDDSGPVLPLRCLHEHSTDHPPHSQPTIGGSEEDWARSDKDASDSTPRRRLGKKHRLNMPARARGSTKQRKGNSAGPTASEPPTQVLRPTSPTDEEFEWVEEINKTCLLEDGSDDDLVPVLPLCRLHEHSTDHPPHSQPTNGGSEEDWARSDDDASDSEPRRRLCKKPKHHLDMPARARRSSKRRKGNSAGPTASEPPIQVQGITTDTKVESDKEGDGCTAAATDPSSPTPADTVFLCNGDHAATPSDLFDMVKRNIRLGSTTYTCSYVTVSKGKPTREILKVYCCSMVSSPQGWVSKPSFREPKNKSPTDPKKCRGKIAGHFCRNSYYFRPHGTVVHACQLQHGGRRRDVDFRPPLMTITAPPIWGITDMVIEQMITSLQSCSEKWWDSLPGQGASRKWLKRIGEASTPAELDLKQQIEEVMTPYFRYAKTIYPAMSAWKVGALRTKAGAPSQYEKQ